MEGKVKFRIIMNYETLEHIALWLEIICFPPIAVASMFELFFLIRENRSFIRSVFRKKKRKKNK